MSKQEISLNRNELLAIIVSLSGTKMNPVNIGLLNKCFKAIEKIDGGENENETEKREKSGSN